MHKIYKPIILLIGTIFLLGCTPVDNRKPSITTPIVGSNIQISAYGYPPKEYRKKIKNYFFNKLNRKNISNYVFSKPQRAFKRKGLAYGGAISWKGWLVDVTVTTRSRTGRVRSPKPYMILFKGSAIVEDILGIKHKLLTRVGR